jgi:uncharacterized iron-regulated membrane protein
MAEALRDPERVVVRFPTIVTRPEADELDEDDESFFAEMMEKSLSEFFVDHVIWPLLGVAILALLILVITGSLWLSAKMAFDIKALLV